MEISRQTSAIQAQTKIRRLSACLIALVASFACTTPERDPPAKPALSSPSAPATVNEHVHVPDSAVPQSDSGSAQHFTVAVIGDSLTDFRSHGGGYLTELKAHCPSLEFDNFGKGGAMVNQMRRTFEAQVVASGKHYTHLLVFGGVNDLYSDLTALRTPAKIEADLGAMYDWAHAHDVRVIAFTVAPWGGFKRYFNASRAAATHELNAWIRAQVSQGRVDHVVDADALLSCGDPDRLCDRFFEPFKDGLHFGPEAHRILGQTLFQSAFSDCR